MPRIGVIIIGRNEGERLATCLGAVRRSLAADIIEIVYVDSNSTDNSVQIALGFGANVLQLNPAVPFTAARARNAGAELLLKHHPGAIDYLQFLDGDTEVHPKWIAHAADYLDRHPPVAVACGRRRERAVEASTYNLLADMEWDTRIGATAEFGGDALIRTEVFARLGGYNPRFIAGEEPEFAARIRMAGHKIMRLNHEMTRHDLAMTRFRQWWRRTVRSGHALAQLAHVHGGPPLFLYRKARRSTLFWAAALPLFILALAVAWSWLALILFPLAYGLLAFRITRHRLRHGDDQDAAIAYGLFTTIGKFPQLLGLITFYRNLWRRRQSALIEYKGTPDKSAPANPPASPVGTT